jgi:hypothetical protein
MNGLEYIINIQLKIRIFCSIRTSLCYILVFPPQTLPTIEDTIENQLGSLPSMEQGVDSFASQTASEADIPSSSGEGQHNSAVPVESPVQTTDSSESEDEQSNQRRSDSDHAPEQRDGSHDAAKQRSDSHDVPKQRNGSHDAAKQRNDSHDVPKQRSDSDHAPKQRNHNDGDHASEGQHNAALEINGNTSRETISDSESAEASDSESAEASDSDSMAAII